MVLLVGREALFMLPVRKEIFARFQSQDAPTYPHRREAFFLLLPWVSQTLQSKVKLARALTDTPFGGLAELAHGSAELPNAIDVAPPVVSAHKYSS